MTPYQRARMRYRWERFKANCDSLLLMLTGIAVFPCFVIMACVICTDSDEDYRWSINRVLECYKALFWRGFE